MSLKNIVLITGANTGLGLEAVRALCKEATPFEILVGSRSVEKGEAAIAQVKQEIPSTTSTLSTVQVDIESDDSIRSAYEHVASKFGKLDVLVNNAGGNFELLGADGTLTKREAYNKCWDVNVTGTHIMTETFVPLLLKSENPRLLFITSGTASIIETEIENPPNPALKVMNSSPPAGWPKVQPVNPTMAYRSSKVGLNMLMREWHKLLKNDGVKVWCISPGFLATGLGGIGEEKLKKMGALDPSVGGNFIKDVIQGARDHDRGKAIRSNMVQPW